MALQQNQESKKTLELHAVCKLFTPKDGSSARLYNQYYVVVDGIRIVVQIPYQDSTGREIVNRYFNE